MTDAIQLLLALFVSIWVLLFTLGAWVIGVYQLLEWILT